MKYYITLILIIMLLSGCSLTVVGNEEKEKQEAILDFINEDISEVSDIEIQAFKSLDSVSGKNYTDDETMYNELINKTIPTYEQAINKAKSLNPKLKELEPMADQIALASETFYEALILEKKALEKQDEELMQQSNTKMKEYSRIINKYHEDMDKLAEKYDVDYERSNWE